MNEVKEKHPDYLVLINEDHKMPDGYEDTVEKITIENAAGEKILIEKKTYEAFLRLQEDVLKNDGIQTSLTSAYRSIKEQEENFAYHLKNFGAEYTNTYVAKPGHSEHHTGIAIDIGIVLDGKLLRPIDELLAVDHLYKPIQEKAPRYGFILRYPKGKEAITKIGYESWHFHYVDSPALAQEITDQGLCFEEYCQKD